MRYGVIGSGSWATALAKILTGNNLPVNWWIRNEIISRHILNRHHNPHYLSAVYFDTSLLTISNQVADVIAASDCLIIAVPSAYVTDMLRGLEKNIFSGKKLLSAVKGILPEQNLLLNDYFKAEFGVALTDYFTVMGPCTAAEEAAEK